jgi:drug/metabolite transporter superfamily protein YnfA
MYAIFKQRKTYVFLVLGVISLVIAAIVGIEDNPPGIILCYLGFIFFILAFAHNWKKPKPYVVLIFTSVLGFPVFVILHNFIDYLAKGTLFEAVGAFFFVAAILFCPAGAVIGIIGSIYYSSKKQREK